MSFSKETNTSPMRVEEIRAEEARTVVEAVGSVSLLERRRSSKINGADCLSQFARHYDLCWRPYVPTYFRQSKSEPLPA